MIWAVAVAPAAAQPEIDAVERATVRVVVISESPSGRSLFGTGSGFVVAPNLVITNAHVVADARRQPTLGVAIVPPEGEGLIPARIIRYSALMDLALLEFREGPQIEPALISLTEPRPGDAIIALGYPDIDDLQRPAVELVRPTAPSRSTGTITSLRDRAPTGDPIPSINHEASISSGSSGGPLIDECGRVIGVNTWHARGHMTGEDRGVASRTSQLALFLEEAGVQPRVTDERCLSVAERVEAERRSTVEALEQQNQTLAAKLDAAERLTNIAVFVLIAGTIALLAAVGVLGAILIARRGPPAPAPGANGPSMLELDAAQRERHEPVPAPSAAQERSGISIAIVVVGSAIAAFIVTAIAVWFMRSAEPEDGTAAVENFSGPMACAFDAGASTVSDGVADAAFTVSGQLCVNGRTLYAEAPDGHSFQRAQLSGENSSLDVYTIVPASGEFRRERFSLSSTAFEAASQAAGPGAGQSCAEAVRANVARRTEALMRFAEGRAGERMVWRCAPRPGEAS